MAFLEYDGRRFWIAAERVYDAQLRSVGYVAMCTGALLSSNPKGGALAERTNEGCVPGPPHNSKEEALRFAAEFVRLNWDGRNAKRKPAANDRVGHVPTHRLGRIVPPLRDATVEADFVFVAFDDGDTEAVPIHSLVLIPVRA